MRRLLTGLVLMLLMTACSSTQVPTPKQVDSNSVEVRVREGSAPFPDTCSPEDVRDDVTAGSWHGGIDIVYTIGRTARDLPGLTSADGKGVVDCKNKTIAVWSMGAQLILD
jgi:hypothetical protein